MSEVLLPLFIISTILEFVFLGELIGDGIIRIAINSAAYVFFVVLFITTLNTSMKTVEAYPMSPGGAKRDDGESILCNCKKILAEIYDGANLCYPAKMLNFH